MKRLPFNSIFLAIALSGSGAAFAVTPTQPAVDGEISNLAELRWLSQNSSAWSRDWALVADIDATDTKDWNSGAGFMPIGNNTEKYVASFDGNGHSISNLYINRPFTDFVGLFGYISGANEISNLVIKSANLTGSSVVGVLSGAVSGGVLSNIEVIDSRSKSTNSNGYASGFVALAYGIEGHDIQIENSNVHSRGGASGFASSGSGLVSFSNIQLSGKIVSDNFIAGGVIVGINSFGTWSNVQVDVDVTGGDNVGGFGAQLNNGNLNNVSVNGRVLSKGNEAGGLIGGMGARIRVDGCSFNGIVESSDRVGGLATDISLHQNSYKNCVVSAHLKGESAVGGAFGIVTSSSVEFNNLIVTEHSVVEGDRYVGGLIGASSGAASSSGLNVSSSAKVIGNSYTGGLVGAYIGWRPLSFERSYFDGVVDGVGNVGAVVGGLPSEIIFAGSGLSLYGKDAYELVLKDSYVKPVFNSNSDSFLVSGDLSKAKVNLEGFFAEQNRDDHNSDYVAQLFNVPPKERVITDSYYGYSRQQSLPTDVKFLAKTKFEDPESFVGFAFSTPWKNDLWGFDYDTGSPVLNAPEIPVFTVPNESSQGIEDLKFDVGSEVQFTVNAIMESSGTDDDVKYAIVGDKHGFSSVDDYGLVSIAPTKPEHVGEHSLVIVAKHGNSFNAMHPFKVQIQSPVEPDSPDVNDGDKDNNHLVIDHNVNLSGGSINPFALFALFGLGAFLRFRRV
ncbi:TPA: hypothetical protein I7730_01455 [Vibrio vulnificus]|uniref:Uncharacterized protein n=1 Tax=Vibrio vulnificus TaxID=672 RepID=A0A8H9K5Z7_VIBVL|nr:hypothetical protein [Vibrio vulnificus]HAS8538463.1 hypothetical protein [Vibrio vulnificus]